MTRARAIKRARLAYVSLVTRVLVRDLADFSYVIGLWGDWDQELKRLSGIDHKAVVPEHAERRIAFLTREIRRKDIDRDAAVRWLDVYPEAVVEQFKAPLVPLKSTLETVA